ncbi:unnamed protein product [Trypanosoma congolense IL3000]|uniref:WGS project CAEQ00000000 data, annotated contig 70 n=1 Tax=Trypanosoma congolense (strain IL3000) TaxID=1068625 RepID=F9WHY1_TRYCI|nr:unnamed protein product [Trypanosoma congolense IL3000]
MNMEGEREAVPNWTMESEVEQVLIQECKTRDKINLFYFFVEYYGWTDGEFRHLTLGEFLKRPERYLEDAKRREEVQKTMQQMLKRLHDNTIKDVRCLVGNGIITLRDWTLRGASTLLAWTPRLILDEAVREARKHPRSPITSRTTSVQRSNEESDRLTHQVTGTPSTQRQPGGTRDNELEEILQKTCKSWEEVRLVDFLAQEYGKTYGACDPNVTLAAFLENPSHYIEDDAEREEVVEKLPEKLHQLKERIFGNLQSVRAEGMTTGGDCAHHRYDMVVDGITTRVQTEAVEAVLDDPLFSQMGVVHDTTSGNCKSGSTSEWTMESEVGEVLLKECKTRERINLSHFFQQYYGWTEEKLLHLTLGEFLKRPERYIKNAKRHKKVKKDMQQMLKRLHDNTIKDVRCLVGNGIITLRDWTLRRATTLLDHVPSGILDEAVREARKHPRSPTTSRSTSVQRSNEESDRLTHQVTGTPSTQHKPGGTRDNELEEILQKACKSWEEVRLADFLAQEYGKTYGACDPNVTLAAFLENPSHYIENDAEREEVVEKLPEKLHHLRGCILRDVTFLRAVGITTRGQWAYRQLYHEMLTPITNCVLSRKYGSPYNERTNMEDALTV